MALPLYFERTLKHLELFGGRVAYGLTLPTLANADQWLERVENELSPENLTCDGELRGRGLQAKARDLREAHRYLLALKGIVQTPTRRPVTPGTPTHKVGDVVTFRGQQYTIRKIKTVNYEVVAANGRAYNLRMGAI